MLTVPVKENTEFENCDTNDLTKDIVVQFETIGGPIFNVRRFSFLCFYGFRRGLIQCFWTMG